MEEWFVGFSLGGISTRLCERQVVSFDFIRGHEARHLSCGNLLYDSGI